MEIFFYCGPGELEELFLEAEGHRPLVYEPRFGTPPRPSRVDGLLREPLGSCRDFYRFGRAYRDTPPFSVYAPDDPSRDSAPPNLLYFSGPPVSLADPRVLCEGSLFLDPENKADPPRALFRFFRKLFAKRFVKTGYCFVSPSVYARRGEFLFIQRDHRSLAPAWRFGDGDQHLPADIDSWYQSRGETRERYQPPRERFWFFAALEELEQVLSGLESRYQLRYLQMAPRGSGDRSEAVFDTAASFLRAGPYPGRRRGFVCDRRHRMLLYLEIDGSWDRTGKFSGASEAAAIQNAFGDGLYLDFAEKVKAAFHEVDEPRYGPFYVSPSLYARRSDIVFSFRDPYFRLDGDGKAVHLWRKEWGELLARWGLSEDE